MYNRVYITLLYTRNVKNVAHSQIKSPARNLHVTTSTVSS